MRSLSKSKIIAFRQCAKRLWLEVHRPDLREDSAATLASFRVGHDVGAVARKAYDPAGKGATIDITREGFGPAFARSAALLATSRAPVFEAGFQAGGALAFADVMLPAGKKGAGWLMVEVKSSTSVKDYHRDDVAVQTYIARAAGVKVKSVAVAVIDSAWVYPGDGDYRGLFKVEDLTEEAFGRADEVKAWIAEAQDVVARKNEPAVGMGEQCHTPFECGFCQYCSKGCPQPEFPLDWLPGLTAKRRTLWAGQGITDLTQVPDSDLNERQLRVKQHSLARTVDFDAVGAAADLAPYKLPALFLDFETIQFAVPIWKGTRPYQQIPFQFSVHRLSRTSALSHSGFLDLSGNDPSEPFARALVAACGDKGAVFVYNAAFETSRLHELAERFPSLAEPLLAIATRIVDLLPIARARYYHHAQHGSWSIKEVLPAAVPDLSYDSLDGVKDGSMAMVAYAEAIAPGVTAERRAEIEAQLMAYCRLDTFGLVRLWQFLSGRNCAPLMDCR